MSGDSTFTVTTTWTTVKDQGGTPVASGDFTVTNQSSPKGDVQILRTSVAPSDTTKASFILLWPQDSATYPVGASELLYVRTSSGTCEASMIPSSGS